MEAVSGRPWDGGVRGGRRRGGVGEACTDEARVGVSVHTTVSRCADTTYLQRLNKTSLCQTKPGKAGHSLWWGREEGEWVRRVGERRRKREGQ